MWLYNCGLWLCPPSNICGLCINNGKGHPVNIVEQDWFSLFSISLYPLSHHKILRTWGGAGDLFWWEPFWKRHSLHRVTLPTSSVLLRCINCISPMYQVYFSDVLNVFLRCIKCISLMYQVYFSDVSSVFLRCISWVTTLRTGGGCGGNHLARGTHYTGSRSPH